MDQVEKALQRFLIECTLFSNYKIQSKYQHEGYFTFVLSPLKEGSVVQPEHTELLQRHFGKGNVRLVLKCRQALNSNSLYGHVDVVNPHIYIKINTLDRLKKIRTILKVLIGIILVLLIFSAISFKRLIHEYESPVEVLGVLKEVIAQDG